MLAAGALLPFTAALPLRRWRLPEVKKVRERFGEV
jgi:hypothetical protein